MICGAFPCAQRNKTCDDVSYGTARTSSKIIWYLTTVWNQSALMNMCYSLNQVIVLLYFLKKYNNQNSRNSVAKYCLLQYIQHIHYGSCDTYCLLLTLAHTAGTFGGNIAYWCIQHILALSTSGKLRAEILLTVAFSTFWYLVLHGNCRRQYCLLLHSAHTEYLVLQGNCRRKYCLLLHSAHTGT